MSRFGRNRTNKVQTSTGTFCYGCNKDIAKDPNCSPSSGCFVSAEMWDKLKNRNYGY